MEYARLVPHPLLQSLAGLAIAFFVVGFLLLVFFFLLLTICACLTLIKFPSSSSSHHCRQSRKPQIFTASKATEPTNPRLSSGFGAFSLYLSTLLSSQMHSQKQAGTFIASFSLSVCALFFTYIYQSFYNFIA